jgi:hypothetical protein
MICFFCSARCVAWIIVCTADWSGTPWRACRLKQELAKKSLEFEQLKMSVKDHEDARSNTGQDAEAVKGLLAAEEEKRRTLMADLEREVRERWAIR